MRPAGSFRAIIGKRSTRRRPARFYLIRSRCDCARDGAVEVGRRQGVGKRRHHRQRDGQESRQEGSAAGQAGRAQGEEGSEKQKRRELSSFQGATKPGSGRAFFRPVHLAASEWYICPMLIQDRLTSRSSRSLAAMIGFGRAGACRGHGGRSGSPDDDRRMTAAFPRTSLLPPFSRPASKSIPATHATDALRCCPIVPAARRIT